MCFNYFIASFIYNFISRQLGVVIFLTGMGACLFVSPHTSSLTSLYVVTAALGVCNGAYDASQVVWIMEMWQAESGPFIQGQHFFFAIGTLIPGLVMAPFLSQQNQSDVDPVESTTLKWTQNTEMWIPFTSIGILMTISALVQLYLLSFKRYVPPPRANLEGISNNQSTNNNVTEEIDKMKIMSEQSPTTHLKLKLIILSAAFLGFDQGMEMCSMQFISTFAQFGDHGFSETQGAYVLTTMTGAYAIGRAFGIVAILKVPAHFILAFNLMILLISNAILLIFADSSVWALWSGAALLGIGFSTVYPSFCAYIERHLVFTNAIGSLMLVSGSLIGAVYPIIIGDQIKANATVLVYVNFFSIACISIALTILLRLTLRKKT